MAKYKKAIVAFGAFLGVVGASLADGTIDATETGAIVVAALGVFGVYRATNAPA